LPQILSVEEVARLIDAADSLSHRTMLMVLYSTGMRNAELRHLQVADIDSRRMVIHIQRGKGGRDRYVPLSPTLLTTLRVYYRWMRPKTWLFPGTVDGWRADKPITPKVLWDAYSVGFFGLAPEGGRPERVLVTWVSGNYFQLLDVRSAVGRLIQADKGGPGRADAVVVLGYSTWQRRFGGDLSAVGRTVRVTAARSQSSVWPHETSQARLRSPNRSCTCR
jgi:hypothetical protein